MDRNAPSAPLSGEWADGMTLGRLYDEVGIEDSDAWVPDDLDKIASVYEEAYYRAYYEEADRMATAMLAESGSLALGVAVVLLFVFPAALFVASVLSDVAEVLGR